jgi:hypothetical protein
VHYHLIKLSFKRHKSGKGTRKEEEREKERMKELHK